MGMARLEELLAFELFAPLDFPGFLSAGVGFSDESIISNEAGIVLFLVGRCKRIEGRTDKMPERLPGNPSRPVVVGDLRKC
jgi:hypothetical protein